MRSRIVAGNWKMNTTVEEGIELAKQIAEAQLPEKVQVILGPPSTHLHALNSVLNGADVALAAQNVHQEEKGAYTGEVSAAMLASLGVQYCIIGHSERRQYFGETDELIAQKILKAMEYGITPIFCCGETLDIREAGNQNEVVGHQVQVVLDHLSENQAAEIIIAYEPVWAIGTGKTASPAQAQEMHAHIRQVVKNKFGEEIANAIPILYGGSCNPKNSQELFALEDVDGGLIGGASLVADDFLKVIRSF